MLKPDLRNLPYTWTQDGVYWAERGSPQASQRLYLLVGTHGQEIAGPMALERLLKDDWRWPNVRLMAVWQDPRAYDEEGYGFVSVDGKRSCWPPLWGYRQDKQMYWFYVDENSAWGNTVAVPPAHQTMRDLMAKCKPTHMLTLHETVRSEVERDLFWPGAGMLLIETWPISPVELSGALSIAGNPLNPVSWTIRTLYDWLRPLFRRMRWHYAAKALKDNPYYSLTTNIADRFSKLGGALTQRKWMEYQEFLEQPVIGLGRLLHDVPFMISDWRTATDFAAGTYGIPGITTETFPVGEIGLRGIDDRVLSQYRYVVATLDELNERDK